MGAHTHLLNQMCGDSQRQTKQSQGQKKANSKPQQKQPSPADKGYDIKGATIAP
jgi:hypothetical protein